MSKPRYLLPLSHDYRRVARDRSYNATQIANAVKGDQDWQLYSFPKSDRKFKRALLGLCLIAVSLFIALDQGYFDWAAFLFQ